MPDASQITQRAKSNLAIALRLLPPDRRADMVVFYAMCRTLDDLADDPSRPLTERERALEEWKNGFLHGFASPAPLQRQVLEMCDRRDIPNTLLAAIADGCMMDLHPQKFQTWEELSEYIWKVACAVGLVSIRVFGCRERKSEDYAVALGRALQLTNILRDVREDFENGGRVYLPQEDLERFGYRAEDLAAMVHDDRFSALMEFEAGRAEGYFREAASVMPAGDRRALAPARMMAEIYGCLLGGMKRDGFRVFEKRYRVSSFRKLAILSKHLIAGRIGIE